MHKNVASLQRRAHFLRGDVGGGHGGFFFRRRIRIQTVRIRNPVLLCIQQMVSSLTPPNLLGNTAHAQMKKGNLAFYEIYN